MSYAVAVDIGGTFTDLVGYDRDTKKVVCTKSATTYENFVEGILDCFAKADLKPSQAQLVNHGTTLVINAFIQRRGAKAALVTTKGFRDVLEIARANRPDPFDLHYQRDAPLIQRSLRYGVTERIDTFGKVLVPLDLEELTALANQLRAKEVESVAVFFLNSYANPEHEHLAAARLRELLPNVYVTCSTDLTREWYEYERTSTVAANAYVGPQVDRYIRRLDGDMRKQGFDGSLFMMGSNGGLLSVDRSCRQPVSLVESGPIGGCIGAGAYAEELGFKNVVAFDMGGTTAKCALVEEGRFNVESIYYAGGYVQGFPIKSSVIDIVEVGSGGGSVAWLDSQNRLHVGPRSAGSTPGPVCYRRGGTEATVTDANLVLGRLNADRFLGGELKLDVEGARAALRRLAEPMMTANSIEQDKSKMPSRVGDMTSACLLACVVTASLIVLGLLAVVVWLAFVQGSPGVGITAYTVGNFAEVFSDSRTVQVFIDTSIFSIVSLFVAMGFGVPAAWLASRTDLPGKTVLFTLMTIGMLVPGFTSAMGWLFLMHPRIGLVNVYLTRVLGFTQPPFNITSLTGMGWVQGLNLAPLAFIMTAAVFAAMDPSLEEAAQMSGATPWRTLRRVILPLASPGVLAASIYIFTIGFAAFDVPVIIGWGNRIFTFSTFLYLLVSPQDVLPKYGVAAALSTIVMVVAAVLSWWYARMQARSRSFAVVTGKAYRPRLLALRWGVIPAWIFLSVFFVLGTILPILLLAWSSMLPFFQMPSEIAFKVASFNHYRNLPWNLVLSGMANTAILMVLTPTVTLAIAFAFSWIFLRSKLAFRAAFDVIAFLPHAIPNIIFGVGTLLVTLYVLQRAVPIYGTIWVLLIVFAIGRLSYATRMTNSGLIQLHPELEESAQMNGASLARVLMRVVVPLLTPTLLYAWLWIALLTFRELTLAVVLSSGGNTTLPVVIWGLWQGGGLGQSSALAMIMLAVMTPLITLYWIIARRFGLAAKVD